MVTRRIATQTMVFLLVVVIAMTSARPAAADGLRGGKLFARGGVVTVTILQPEAAWTTGLYLFEPTPPYPAIRYIASNKDVGTVVDLGPFPAGQEMLFGIVGGHTFLMGPADRNPDGIVHADVIRIDEATWRVEFEDTYDGGDEDYNDSRFLFNGVTADRNGPPDLSVATDPVHVPEGTTATNHGQFVDPDGDAVTLTASIGTITYGAGGTWSWSYAVDDGPAASTTVTIHADDGRGGTDDVSFALNVVNVEPTAVFEHPDTVNEADAFTLVLTGVQDPSTADTAAGFEYDFDCGAGYLGWGTASSATCQTFDDGTLAVRARIRDKDGGMTEYTGEVAVLNLPPVVNVDVVGQPCQYSDFIHDVTFTATDVAADPLTATPSALPASLNLVARECEVAADGLWHTCTWTLTGTMDVPAGGYTVSVVVDDGDGALGEGRTMIGVEPEDATVWLHPANPMDVRVDPASGDSREFTLRAFARETTPDAAYRAPDPGDIANARLSVALVPVGSGDPVMTRCTVVGVVGSGYDAVLEAACALDGIPVNAYFVQAIVDGGYYVGRSAESVVVVGDPGRGFITGGGWFYWPGSGERTNYGFTVKYVGRTPRIQGDLLMIKHLADGSIYRVKSTDLIALAVGERTEGDRLIGWASFVGTATYQEPGWPEAVRNHRFVVYVEDWAEPGTGIDRFWIQLDTADNARVQAVSLDRPALDRAETIDGGNIVVPHQPAAR